MNRRLAALLLVVSLVVAAGAWYWWSTAQPDPYLIGGTDVVGFVRKHGPPTLDEVSDAAIHASILDIFDGVEGQAAAGISCEEGFTTYLVGFVESTGWSTEDATATVGALFLGANVRALMGGSESLESAWLRPCFDMFL